MIDNPSELLTDWLRRVKRAQIAYTRSAAHLEKLHYWLGGTIIFLSTLAGTSLFATNFSIKVASSVASIVAAILAGFQTFYRLSERAEKFRLTSVKYSELRLEIEQKLSFPSPDNELEQYVESFSKKWNRIRQEALTAPQGTWDKIIIRDNTSPTE